MTNERFTEIARNVFRVGLIVTLTHDDFHTFESECNRMFIKKVNFEIIKSDLNTISFRELNK